MQITAYEAGLTPREFWRMTLVEFSLFIEGSNRRVQREDKRASLTGWVTARLSRASRIPSIQSLFGTDKAKKLSPKEAKEHSERHNALIGKLAPDGKTNDELLMQYVERVNKELSEESVPKEDSQ